MTQQQPIVVTGGSGFIGRALVSALLKSGRQVINVDNLSYATRAWPPFQPKLQSQQPAQYQPQALINLAAETHVDHSIRQAAPFIQTNVVGSGTLLAVTTQWWQELPLAQQQQFRFLQVSTDEVFGDLGQLTDQRFNEQTPYAPSSPYSASKAAADHLVGAWARTYGLPTLITHCSNNYGPWQHPEKLIPCMLMAALNNQPLPIYGDGLQVRDWLHVDDHVRAIIAVLTRGDVGQRYVVGANNPMTNLSLVQQLCDELMLVKPKSQGHYRDLMTHVSDRPGHDRCYALDASHIQQSLGWAPQVDFAQGLKQTVAFMVEQLPNQRMGQHV
ncbi:MAG: GDP-mannose 4,6-dehydratase [Moraxellaceae bacterium]|nr:GDP-mannose 4,6-dehydratase [Moraxellaceae bacterium]